MDKKVRITEKEVLSIIENVIEEGRKVIKVGNSAPAPAPMPEMPPAGPTPDEYQDAMGGQEPAMGEPPVDGGAEEAPNQFDTNFDAGVEADEETDPKRYIQQLTGKLSQSLNSFNNEQGGDPWLSKYVANMIVAAACKNLDEKAKKEIIEKINTTDSEDETVPDDGGAEDTAIDDAGAEVPPIDNGEMAPPVQEGRLYSKKELNEFLLGRKCSGEDEKRPAEKDKKNSNIPKAWRGKKPIMGGISK